MKKYKYKIEMEKTQQVVTRSASWVDVLIWVVTFGRKGKTHVQYLVPATLYKTPTHINCRCSIKQTNKEHQE